ncbi:MAG: hypothetical protein AB8G11_24810 [Saprospiraceae bacterium]
MINPTDQFWQYVKTEIEEKHNPYRKPVDKWRKGEIESFLIDLSIKVEELCENDKKKNDLCGFNYNISYDTFRRIFFVKSSSGQKTTRHLFAIFLGYDSYFDFLKSHNLYIENFNQNVLIINDFNQKQEAKSEIPLKDEIMDLLRKNKFRKAINLLDDYVSQHNPNYLTTVMNLQGKIFTLEEMTLNKELTAESLEVEQNGLRRRVTTLLSILFD